MIQQNAKVSAYPVVRRERRPHISSSARKRTAATLATLLTLYKADGKPPEDLKPEEIKSAARDAYLALGGKGKNLSDAPGTGTANRMVESRESGAPGTKKPPAGAKKEKKKKAQEQTPAFPEVVQALLDSRPELRDKLLPIANLTQPASVRAAQMRSIISQYPPITQ